MDTKEAKKYQKASTVCCSANVLFFLAYQCAFLEEISPLRILLEFSRVARRTCRKFLDFSFACQSSSHSHFLVILYTSFPTGKFEDFKALGALLELSIGYCKKIDCKKALEVLPTMPWAAQIKTLGLSQTDIEGTAEYSFVSGAPVRNS